MTQIADAMITTIDLTTIPPLTIGSHENMVSGACVMEAVSFIAGEPWSDSPQCTCPVIGAFLRAWNDGLSDDERDALLRPLIPRLIGTRGTHKLELRRSVMAADWLIRVHTPAWLRLAKLDIHAEALIMLPEITDFAQCPSLMPTLMAAKTDSVTAWAAARATAWATAWATASAAARAAAWDAASAAASAAAWDAASAAARDAASAAARDAAWDAARATAWAAARAAARDAARATAWAAAWATASAAARDAASAAARDALNATRLELQKSALDLVVRMIEATEP